MQGKVMEDMAEHRERVITEDLEVLCGQKPARQENGNGSVS